MTVFGPVARRPEPVWLPSSEAGSLRRRLLVLVPLFLSAALLGAALRLVSGMRDLSVPSAAGSAADPVQPSQLPAGASLSDVFSPTVRYWSEKILGWSRDAGLDPNLVAAVMQIESCGNPQARSSAGAMGLFQVMPYHFAAGDDPWDPDTNARRGLAYLAAALELAGGQTGLALAGYNGGHGVISWPEDVWPAETRRYVDWGIGILADVGPASLAGGGLTAWMGAGGSRLCEQAAQALGLEG